MPIVRVPVGLLVLLALTPALAGCLSEPSTVLTARQGDLVRAELVVLDRDGVVLPEDLAGRSMEEACGVDLGADPNAGCPPALREYVVATSVPADLPDGWAGAKAVPEGLLPVFMGVREGGWTVSQGVLAFGLGSPELVEAHAREGALPRIVETAEAYGRSWNVTRLDNASARLEPDEGDIGASVEAPSWCNERFCLFESELVGFNDTHLHVSHQAEQGDQVHIASLNTFLTVVEANGDRFVVDGNDPRAGASYDVYIRVTDIRAPPEGVRRAPAFDLTTVHGEHISLDDLLGQPVVLEFFATWCPSCIENTRHLRALEDQFGSKVQIVSIDVSSLDQASQLESFIRDNGVTWPVAVDQDGSVARSYGVGALSTEVIVDPEGTIVHVETGVANHDRVVGVIEGLLSEAEA